MRSPTDSTGFKTEWDVAWWGVGKGEELEMEKLNPLPGSSSWDNISQSSTRRERQCKKRIAKQRQCPVPSGVEQGSPPGHWHPEGEEGEADRWLSTGQPQGRLAATSLLQDPGLMVLCFFCCCLNSSITHRAPRSLRAKDAGSHHHPSAVVSPLRLPKVQSSRI